MTYDYTLRSFGISSLSRLIPEASSLPEYHVLHGSGANSVLDANASIINLGDARSAMQTMHKLLPFLGDKSSKTMFQSADEVVKVLWAHLENEEGLVKGKDVSRLQIGVSNVDLRSRPNQGNRTDNPPSPTRRLNPVCPETRPCRRSRRRRGDIYSDSPLQARAQPSAPSHFRYRCYF